MITYEYPLNERIRTLLRLEDLFERTLYFVQGTGAQEHHIALITLFEILEVAGRAEAEVRTASASGNRHLFDDHGGVITVEVPSKHQIEIDAKTPKRTMEGCPMVGLALSTCR